MKSPYKNIISLFESPFKLNNPWNPEELAGIGENAEFTNQIKNNSLAKYIGDFEKYEIYQYQAGKWTIICLINGNYTNLFFQYVINNNNIIESKNIWTQTLSNGLARKFVMDYLLKHYNGILSDGAHTDLGQKYWDKLLHDAQSKGYKTYVQYDDDKGKLTNIPLNNLADINKYYSHGDEGFYYKFLILKK